MSKKHRKPWSVEHQTMVAVSVTSLLIFGAVFILGYYVPKKPLPPGPRAHLSLQETRR